VYSISAKAAPLINRYRGAFIRHTLPIEVASAGSQVGFQSSQVAFREFKQPNLVR
jgi:hypothetical protein